MKQLGVLGMMNDNNINPAHMRPSWPFLRNTPSYNFDAPEMRSAYGNPSVPRDPAYYAGLPGAIRGSASVIYYPSCNPKAFFQPAIINYCAGYEPDDYGRSMKLKHIVENSKTESG